MKILVPILLEETFENIFKLERLEIDVILPFAFEIESYGEPIWLNNGNYRCHRVEMENLLFQELHKKSQDWGVDVSNYGGLLVAEFYLFFLKRQIL